MATPQTLPIVLVAGSTGLVGRALIEELIGDPRVGRVIALSRRALPLRHEKLSIEIVDFENLEAAVATKVFDTLFCCLGSTIRKAGSQEAFARVDRDYPIALARGATVAGAREFQLVTALGADSSSRVFYNRTKGEAEQGVRAAFSGTLRIFRPSLLLGARDESRPAEALAMALSPLLGPLLIGRLAEYRPVSAEVVARAMCRRWGTASGALDILSSRQIQELGRQKI